MRIEHVLLAMSPKQQKQLATILHIPELSKRRDEAIAMLALAFCSEQGVQRVWATLSEIERRVCAIALAEMHSDGYVLGISRGRLLAAIEDGFVLVGEVDAALSRLHELGLLGYTQIWYIGDGYEAVGELATYLARECAGRLPGYLDNVEAVHIKYGYGRMMARDIARLATRIAVRPLPLTKQGIIYKREVSKLKPMFRSFDSAGIQLTGHWQDIPYSLFFALRFLELSEALIIKDGSASLHGSHTAELLAADETIWRQCMNETVQNVLNYGHLHLYGIMTSWLQEAEVGRWYPLEQALAQRLSATDKERPWRQSVRHFLRVMALSGRLDIGLHPELGELVRLRPIESEAIVAEWVAQPNLELLVPEVAPAALHFLAGQLGELHRADEMSSYRLTKQSILQLCDRGWSGAEIEQALQSFSRTPIAQSLLRTLRDWVSEYDKAVLWDVLLVRFQSAELLEQFMRDPRGRRAVVEPVGEKAVIVRRSAEKTVRETLNDLGAPSPQGVRTPSDELATTVSKGRGADTKANQLALRKLLSPSLIEVIKSQDQKKSPATTVVS